MEKKGQITTFIVIGIVVLFAVGFVLYAASLQGNVSTTPVNEGDVESYIGSCLQQVSKEAIVSIGMLGGYLETPLDISINERAYFSFSERTDPKIPLWYFRGKLRVPTIKSMQEQISNYTVANIESCIADFETFKTQYEINKTGNVSVTTTIEDRSTTVTINYPITVKDKQTGNTRKVTTVSRIQDVKLGRMYDMAVDILETEDKKLFLENLTIDIMAASSEIPFSGLEFSCKPKTWKKTDIVSFAKNALSYNIRKITVEGNKVTLFNENIPYEEKHYYFPMETKYTDILASFQYYSTSRFELHTYPSDRSVIKSQSVKPDGSLISLLPFCVQTWNFAYDLEYPVMVTLKDESAFSGDGFVFNFGIPVTITANKGSKEDLPATLTDYTSDYSSEFCEGKRNSQTDIRAVDAYTGEELYKANIQYKCVNYLCDYGNTTAKDGVYRIKANLPSGCTNGIVTASKEGYLDGEIVDYGSDAIYVPLVPIKKFSNVEFVVHDSSDLSKTYPLEAGESVILFVESNSTDFYQTYGENISNELELIKGSESYNVDALLMRDDEWIIGGFEGTWNVGYSSLADANTIVVHLVKKLPLGITTELQQETAEYLFTNDSYQAALQPTFK